MTNYWRYGKVIFPAMDEAEALQHVWDMLDYYHVGPCPRREDLFDFEQVTETQARLHSASRKLGWFGEPEWVEDADDRGGVLHYYIEAHPSLDDGWYTSVDGWEVLAGAAVRPLDTRLHPAAVQMDDILRDPEGSWWKVVSAINAETTTREGTHLARMPADRHARLDGIAAIDGFPVPGHPEWVRVDLDADRARASFEEAQRALHLALRRSLDEQEWRLLSWKRGGEDNRE